MPATTISRTTNRATSAANSNLPGLLQWLVSKGTMNPMEAAMAVQQSQQNGSTLVSWLVKNNTVPSIEIARAISEEHKIPLIDPGALPLNETVKSIFSAEQIQKLQALPILKEGSNVTIAIADPVSLDKVQEVQFTIDGNVKTAVVEYNAFQKLIKSRLQANNDDDILNGDVGLSISDENRNNAYYLDSLDLERFENDDLAITRFVDRMLEHAIKQKVSDIHIEPYEETFRVRYRIDGILHVVSIPPKKSAQQLVSRLKVMSRMNISERRIPQDGNIRFEYDNGHQKMDFRVNTLPTMHGEKVVLRILDSSAAKMGIDKLGFEPTQKQTFLSALKKPDGMILVTGPTGSGKTVTLYTGLNILNRAEKNISTAEDPVEIQLPGINQVHVNSKVGLTFAESLRAFLRQDPDIIMVGEIRDLETAEIAVKAAQTGHLVLSTLHTNSAPETLTRLINMGVPAFSIASSVNLIIAQRLARRLCSCKEPAEYSSEALLSMGFEEHELNSLKLFKPKGCELCTDGYKGRVGIYQVMPISEAMGRIVMDGGTAIDLADQAAKEGVLDLRQSGLEKARQGHTSIEEVDRITKD
jgi:type IV pilus assembly protein PilB